MLFKISYRVLAEKVVCTVLCWAWGRFWGAERGRRETDPAALSLILDLDITKAPTTAPIEPVALFRSADQSP